MDADARVAFIAHNAIPARQQKRIAGNRHAFDVRDRIAKLFAQRNSRAYLDPRSEAHFEDAREFFARGQRRYDVVVSEPSNPWVSGVASLFTQEFYRGVKRSLKSHLSCGPQ